MNEPPQWNVPSVPVRPPEQASDEDLDAVLRVFADARVLSRHEARLHARPRHRQPPRAPWRELAAQYLAYFVMDAGHDVATPASRGTSASAVRRRHEACRRAGRSSPKGT